MLTNSTKCRVPEEQTSVNAGTWLQPQEIHGERMIKMNFESIAKIIKRGITAERFENLMYHNENVTSEEHAELFKMLPESVKNEIYDRYEEECYLEEVANQRSLV